MKRKTRKRLKKAGWAVGNASDFLGLSQVEEAPVEIRLALGDEVRASRKRTNLTQKALAKRIGSSQSRVAKIETGDATVSNDLQMKALLTAGSKRAARCTATTQRTTSTDR